MDSEAPKSEQIELAAIHWFVRQQSDVWTDADQSRLDSWLEEATAHRIEYLRVTTVWSHAARLKALGAGVPPGVIPAREAWGDARFSWGAASGAFDGEPTERHGGNTETRDGADSGAATFRRLAAAASVLLVLAAGVYIFSSGLSAGTRYSTPVGGTDDVPLADGSEVTLNTDTRIRVDIGDTERHIELEQGEAFFDVAKDRSRPFVVSAGDKRITAVGTKFSVRRDGEDVQVVVTEGRVRLARAAEHPVPPTYLSAGAIARTAKSQVMVQSDAGSEAEKLLSWRRGYVSFDNVALADAVAEFNRYSTRQISIEDPAIAAVRVGGNFRSDNADAFLDLLQSGFPIEVEAAEDRIVLKAR